MWNIYGDRMVDMFSLWENEAGLIAASTLSLHLSSAIPLRVPFFCEAGAVSSIYMILA
jgi:hypothetical protein